MTSELPEMRASDAERERIAEALREGVAEGRLTMEEFEERLDAAYRARTHGELEPLVRDLPVPGQPAGVGTGAGTGAAGRSAEVAGGGVDGDRVGGEPTSRFAMAVMGGFQRKGRWTVPSRFTAFALMGGGEIDLREARFATEEVVIRCFALMGGVQVTVDPDLDVRVSGVGIMGGFDHSEATEGLSRGPRVVVTGLAIFGGVGIERKLRRADRKRLRDERREERRGLQEERREERRSLRKDLGGERRGSLEEGTGG